jgi:hemerythrin-like metal-binding protein
VEFAKTHFAREEAFFAQTDYPVTAAHIKEHHGLTQKVQEIQQRYNKGLFDALSLNTMSFLKEWLNGHILGSDKKYTAHLNAKGIH